MFHHCPRADELIVELWIKRSSGPIIGWPPVATTGQPVRRRECTAPIGKFKPFIIFNSQIYTFIITNQQIQSSFTNQVSFGVYLWVSFGEPIDQWSDHSHIQIMTLNINICVWNISVWHICVFRICIWAFERNCWMWYRTCSTPTRPVNL